MKEHRARTSITLRVTTAQGEEPLHGLLHLGLCFYGNVFLWNWRDKVEVLPTFPATSLQVGAGLYLQIPEAWKPLEEALRKFIDPRTKTDRQ